LFFRAGGLQVVRQTLRRPDNVRREGRDPAAEPYLCGLNLNRAGWQLQQPLNKRHEAIGCDGCVGRVGVTECATVLLPAQSDDNTTYVIRNVRAGLRR